MSGYPVRAREVRLTASQRHRLKKLTRSYTTPHHLVLRASIVLLAARGIPNTAIAQRLHIHVDTVRKWRNRFAGTATLDALTDRPRSGRPARFTPVQVAEIKALACQLPAESDTGLARWSCPELAREAITRGVVDRVSASTVRRWLAEDPIKPWRHQSWIFIRDPDFAVKATRVLDLYHRRWQGQPLGDDEYVISSDEKPSIQARHRRHRTLAPARSRPMRVEHEYKRGGALAYLAAYDVGRARVFGRCAPSTGIAPFMALVEQVMTTEPYASAKRVFWIVDNGSSHRGQRAITRLSKRFPNAVMVHTPIHASWLNQVEIYFSIIQRKVLSPNDFTDLDQVEQRLHVFQQRYNVNARPFKWKFTPTDLEDLLARIDRHETQRSTVALAA